MNVSFDVITPALAGDLPLTTLARVRSDLNLSATLYADPFVTQMIDSASAAIVNYLNIASDGEHAPTLALETLEESFTDFCGSALALSRAPIADVISVEEDGVDIARLQTGADGAVDINVDAAAFSSPLGPDGTGFNSGHVGKPITITGAGAAGADHSTTIAAVIDAQNVTLTAPALTSVGPAAYIIDNPAFAYEWRRAGGLLFKNSGGYRITWSARRVRVVYDAGYVMPSASSGRNLPLEIEDACVLMVRRRIDQLRESDTENRRIKAESIPGVGSWTFDIAEIKWEAGLPSDVRAIIDRFKRRSV